MRLDAFQQEVVSRVIRYAVPVTDDSGDQAYELLIVGHEQRVRETFAMSDIEATIRPGVAEEEWREEAQRALSWEDQVVSREAFDDPAGWAKPPRREPPAEDRILVTLRATRPGGTGFNVTFRNLTLFSTMIFAVASSRPMSWFTAQVRPSSGDPDLFLLVGGARVAGIFDSNAPGLIWDTVWAQMIFGISVPFVPLLGVVPFISPSTTQLHSWGWVV
jgi:hypothetical protein